MKILNIIIRIVLILVMAGIIGYEREFKSRPAGMRTHILVGVGATVIALIQTSIMEYAIQTALAFPEQGGVIRSDPARLIAQVVSGVGFLGAGTIIVQRKAIVGLTTAASLWATAGLGLAIGMGYYWIAIIAFIAVVITLVFLQKIIVIQPVKKLEIHYTHIAESSQFIQNYFKQKNIIVKDADMSVEIRNERRVYMNFYTIELPKSQEDIDVIEDISMYKNVTKIRMTST